MPPMTLLLSTHNDCYLEEETRPLSYHRGRFPATMMRWRPCTIIGMCNDDTRPTACLLGSLLLGSSGSLKSLGIKQSRMQRRSHHKYV